MIETLTDNWIAIAAPLVAAAGLILWYGYVDDNVRGPRASWWNGIRRLLLPLLDELARRHELGYAAYDLGEEEFVTTVDASIAEVEAELWDIGFERMPLSAFKTTADGRPERGSWAHRDGPLAERQLHVMLFDGVDGGVDLYAHDEYNAFHPRYALKHYRGKDLDVKVGERKLREMLQETGLQLSE